MSESTQQLPLLPIDKSFAHAVNAGSLAAFCKKCEFLVPSAFYYEIFDAEPEKRPQTLTGFEDFRRIDIPTLLRRETTSGKPIDEVFSPRKKFNRKVLSSDWKLSAEELLVQNDYKTHVVDPALAFWNSVIDQRNVIGFSEDELKAVKGSPPDFVHLCETLRDPDRIRKIAIGMNFPHASIIDESWFHFRHYQALVLQGLILLRRYQNPKDMRSQERLEHDLHDVEYLTLGLIAGHLATNEISNDFNKFSMKWRFELLRPDGLLVTPASLSSLL